MPDAVRMRVTVWEIGRHCRLLVVVGLFLWTIPSLVVADDPDSIETTGQFQVTDWQGYNQVQTLRDGTLLHHYIAESRIVQAAGTATEPQLLLRLSFLPRFQCSPLIDLIELLPGDMPSRDRVARAKLFNRMRISIDDEPLPYPAVVELLGNDIHGYYDAPLERRMTLRILLELGSRLQVDFGEERSETLSLLGSRRALETVLGRCKNHN